MADTQIVLVGKLLDGGKVLQTGQMVAAGVHPESLQRAVSDGVAVQYARSVYVSGSAPFPDNVGFAAVSLINPGGVVCMASAASYHRLSDENPFEIWYAVDKTKVRKPIRGSQRDPVRTQFWAPEALSEGVDTIEVGGVPVRITNKARTVMDLLRYRAKVGDEPGMKALKDYVVDGGDVKEIWRLAEALGCAHRIEPFMRVAEEMQTAIPGMSS